MTETTYRVALCGLNQHDERVVASVLARVSSPRYRYAWVTPDSPCDIALFDQSSPSSAAQLAQLRRRNPSLASLALTDAVVPAGTRHRLCRRALWSGLVAALDALVTWQLHQHGARGSESPAMAAPGASAARTPAAPSSPARARLRALIVDDSATVRAQLAAVLHKSGIDSAGAADWDAAAKLIERAAYDLVFLDVIMPGIDGYEACRRLRRNPATHTLPVVMLTSRSSALDRARGTLAGCDIYLVKPLEPAAFHAAVSRVVARICHNDLQQARQRGFIPAGAWPGS